MTYLQDLGFALWTPGRTGPLLLLGRGRFALLGLFFIYGPTYGCLFLNPINYKNLFSKFSKSQSKVENVVDEDRVVWIDSRNDTFSMKSLYATFESRSLIPFLTRVSWNSWFPSEASSFEWEDC